MALLWLRGNEFVSIRDTEDKVRDGHLRLVPSVTTAPEVGPRLHLRELREYGLRVDPIHTPSKVYSLDPHQALAWWVQQRNGAA